MSGIYANTSVQGGGEGKEEEDMKEGEVFEEEEMKEGEEEDMRGKRR